jgi:hypothetical protein
VLLMETIHSMLRLTKRSFRDISERVVAQHPRRQHWIFLSTQPSKSNRLNILFPVEAFCDPWTNEWLSPLIGCEDRDKRSRFVIQLIQERFHDIPARPDKLTQHTVFHELKLLSSARTSLVGSAHRANCILQACELFHDRFHDKDLPHPTAHSYRTVLTLYAKEQDTSRATPLRCLEILERMKRRHLELGDVTMEVTAQLYLPVFVCWAKCNDEHKAVEAIKLWKELKPRGLVDIQSYEQVLISCGSDVELAQSVWPDKDMLSSKTFFLFMVCLRNLTDVKKRDELLLTTFVDCCQSGYVNLACLKELHRGSQAVWNKMALRATDGRWTPDLSDADPQAFLAKLPSRWTRNSYRERK